MLRTVWGGTLVADALFSTDKLIELYEKSLALKTFYLLATDVTERAGASYASGGGTLDAQTFLAGVDVLYNVKLEAVDYAKEFYDLVYDKAVFGKVFKGKGEYQRILDDVSRVRTNLEEMRDSLYGNFRVSFHEDNPALYRQYFGDGVPHAMGSPDLAQLVEAGSAIRRANGDGGADENGSRTSPDASEMQAAPEAYEAYAAKLQEYVATYGAPSVGSGTPYSAEGVCVAELVDFDVNGIEELLVIYYDRESARDTFSGMNDGAAYVAEVWAYEDGELRQAYRQPTQSTNAGFAYQSRSLIDDGTSWMESEEYTNGHYFDLWEIADGASSVRHFYEVRDEYTANESHWSDGVEEHRYVSEWEASFFTERVLYHLMSSDGPDAERTGSSGGERYYTPYGCVDLALETMRRLGVPLDGVPESEPTSTDDRALIESRAKAQIVYTSRADYDSDGLEEEFVVTGSPVNEYDWIDAELWLVSSDGQVSRVAGEETFGRMLAHGEDSTLRLRDPNKSDGSTYKFFCVESTAGGPTSLSHAYGVRDGGAIEIPFDVEYVGNARSDESLEQVVGSVSVLDNGRKWQKYGFVFDSEALEFISTGPIGVPEYAP